MYFIKSGVCKALRKVDFRIPKNSEEANNVEFLTSNPTDLEYVNLNLEQKLLEVDELMNGDIFGEQAAFLKEPIQFSVVTTMPTEVYIIQDQDFMKFGNIIK